MSFSRVKGEFDMKVVFWVLLGLRETLMQESLGC